ncbi:MAG: hypothetical protein AAF317_11300 [Pseudomonadota bacterium]
MSAVVLSSLLIPSASSAEHVEDAAVLEAIRTAVRYSDITTGERTRQVLESALQRAFNTADVDANGRLDVEDRVLREQVLVANSRSAYLGGFAQYDLNGDRILTDAEVEAFAAYEVRARRGLGGASFPVARDAMISRVHARLEVDEIGTLSLREYSRQLAERLPSDPASLRSGLGPLPPDAAPFDADGDGVVRAEEFFGAVRAGLDRLDTNDDGIYEDSELE